jgi:hypothetical protein
MSHTEDRDSLDESAESLEHSVFRGLTLGLRILIAQRQRPPLDCAKACIRASPSS